MKKKKNTKWQGIIILLLLLLFFLKDKIFGAFCGCPKTKFLSAVISEPTFESANDSVEIDVEAFERSEDQNVIVEKGIDFSQIYNVTKDSLTLSRSIYG